MIFVTGVFLRLRARTHDDNNTRESYGVKFISIH